MTMSTSEETVVREIPALGRDLSLGSLYSVHTCKVGIDPVQELDIEVDKSMRGTRTVICPVSEMDEKFNISDQCRLDILLDPQMVSGSAEVLLHKDDTKDQVLLIHTAIKEDRRVDDNFSTDESVQFTHRIISARYGIRTVFLFETAKRKTEAKSLLDLVSKLVNNTSNERKHGEKSLRKKAKVTVFADVPLTEEIHTMDDAIKCHQKLDRMTAREKGIVQSVEISQLGAMTYSAIPRGVITGLAEFLRSMTECINISASLHQNHVLDELPVMKDKIARFNRTNVIFFKKLKDLLRETLRRVRLGETDPKQLKAILDGLNNSPFHLTMEKSDKHRGWVFEQVDLCNILEDVKQKKKRNLRLLPGGDKVPYSRAESTAVFYLRTTADEKEFLNSMAEFARLYPRDVSTGNDPCQTTSLHQYDGSNSQNRILCDFLALSANEQVQFLVTEESVAQKSTTGGGQSAVEGSDPSESSPSTEMYEAARQDHAQIRVFKFKRGSEPISTDFIPPPQSIPPAIVEASHDKATLAVGPQRGTIQGIEIVVETYYGTSAKVVKVVGNPCDPITIDGLNSSAVYRARFRCLTILGPSDFSPEQIFVTAPCGTPAHPTVLQVSPTGCMVQWGDPHETYSAVRYRNKLHRGWEVEMKLNGGETKTAIFYETQVHHQLEPSTVYQFRVRVVHQLAYQDAAYYSTSQYSEWSQPFQLSTSETQIAKNRTLLQSIVLKPGFPSIRLLQLKNDFVNTQSRLRRLTIGPAKSQKPMKTILVVGASGAGKSTLINAFANYLLGVKFEDDYRFSIIDENLQANQSQSQTKFVTAYVLYHQATFPEELPYSLTIIDTPGFGDTQGIKADKEITDQLSEYFHSRGHEGIDSLHAVGFVVQASLPRLTPSQQYIFDSILALFGKDVKDNIFALLTFADGQNPPVVAALDEAKVPYKESFKFNNSALFADRGSPAAMQHCDTNSSKFDHSFDYNFWMMGVSSYKKFFSELCDMQPISLTLTNQVLDERQRLEVHVTGIQQQINAGLYKQENLRAGLNCLQQHQTDIERNKEFEFDVTTQKVIAIPLEKGKYVTNCLTCNMTCHYPCMIPNDENKDRCWAMNDGVCRICPAACHWSVHRNTPERLEIQTVTQKQTVGSMKQEYEDACEERLTTEDLIVKIVEDIAAQELHTGALVDEVRESLQKLSLIALRPDHMTTTGYIDTLIQSEKYQARDGWQMRVTQLEAVRQRAETTRKIAEYEGSVEPWKEIREMARDSGGRLGSVFFTFLTKISKTMFSAFLRNSSSSKP